MKKVRTPNSLTFKMSDLHGFSFDGINFTERLFSFQINELLKQIPKYQYSEDSAAQLGNVIQQLNLIPKRKTIVDGSKKVLGTVKLFREKDLKRKDWNITIAPPSKISFVKKLGGVIDVAIQMPREMFLEKDYLDYKYLFKRAVYLEAMKDHLRSALKGAEIEICNDVFGISCLKPCLLLSFEEFKIRIIPVIHEDGYFNKMKLDPAKCCIRKDEEEGVATPFYNKVILEDAYFAKNFEEYQRNLFSHTTFVEALQLIELWSARRGLIQRRNEQLDTFPEYFYYDIILKLFKDKKIVPEMKNHVIFREILIVISKIPIQEIMNEYKASGFSDNFSGDAFNVAFRVPSCLAQSLVNSAELSTTIFPDGGKAANQKEFDALKFLFLTQFTQSNNYDVVLRLELDYDEISEDELFARKKSSALCSKMMSILKTAFLENDRAKSLAIFATEVENTFHICINLSEDSVGAFSNAEFGPDINSGDNESKLLSKDFREFWGEKSQLRRYKDGSIKETVTWESSSSMAIFCEIAKYVFESKNRVFNLFLI
jgi:U3 small nucleolar RNA-associated protein 22